MSIFDRCHHSLAAETPDKYERDSNDITYFYKSLFSLYFTTSFISVFLCYTHKFTTVCKWIREANTHRHCSSNLPVTSVTDLVSIHSIQYIPRNMHTVFALLCFVVVIHWLIFPYPSGLLHWHCGNLTIAPVPAKQPWWIWINTSFEFIMNDYITTTKQSTTKPCAYFLGYTVLGMSRPHQNKNDTKGSFSHWM